MSFSQLEETLARRVAKVEQQSGEQLSKRVLKREYAAIGKLRRLLAQRTKEQSNTALKTTAQNDALKGQILVKTKAT